MSIIPKWAAMRALVLVNDEFKANPSVLFNEIQRRAFARYIAEHETPPLEDPLVTALRSCCSLRGFWPLPDYQIEQLAEDLRGRGVGMAGEV